jgi:hypothetical protein
MERFVPRLLPSDPTAESLLTKLFVTSLFSAINPKFTISFHGGGGLCLNIMDIDCNNYVPDKSFNLQYNE